MHLTDARDRARRRTPGAAGDGAGDAARRRRPAAASPRLTARRPRDMRPRCRRTARTLAGPPADRAVRAALRDDPAANVAGGAALLADAPADAGRPLSADPADWYGAVARYSGADDRATAAAFADDVFDVIRHGPGPHHRRRPAGDARRRRRTRRPRPGQAARAGPARGRRDRDRVPAECPRLACEWMPGRRTSTSASAATTATTTWPTAAPQTDRLHRHPRHRGLLRGHPVDLVQDPTYVAWHYTVRSSRRAHRPARADQGRRLARRQLVRQRHVDRHRARGLPGRRGAWYTEAMYRVVGPAGAVPGREVRHPAGPRSTSSATTTCRAPTPRHRGHAHRPGPVLGLGALLRAAGRAVHATAARGGDVVTIDPDYATNQPVYTGCERRATPARAHGSDAVRLHTAPSEDAPLVKDIGLHGRRRATTGGVRHRRPRLDRPAVRGRRAGRATGRRSGTSARRRGSSTRRRPTAVPARVRGHPRPAGRGPGVRARLPGDVRLPQRAAYQRLDAAPVRDRARPVRTRVGLTVHRLLLRRERLQPGQARHRHGHGPLPPDPARATGSCSCMAEGRARAPLNLHATRPLDAHGHSRKTIWFSRGPAREASEGSRGRSSAG